MVAALCDIHGNLAAREAVLADVPEEATVVVGGDIVAGGEQPLATLLRLQQLGERVRWVRGNVDRELTPGEAGYGIPEALDHARSQPSEQQIAWLHDLPTSITIDGVLYCHASPRNDLDIFTEQTPEEQIAFLFEDVDAEAVVCGHTHGQFERTIAGRRVLNAGSVGASTEDKPGAYWLLDLQHRSMRYHGATAPQQTREQWLDWLETLAVRAT